MKNVFNIQEDANIMFTDLFFDVDDSHNKILEMISTTMENQVNEIVVKAEGDTYST